MAADTEYYGLLTSDDSIEEEDELYVRHRAGLLEFWKDRLCSSKYFPRWSGFSVVSLYVLSGILVFASSKLPTEAQCTRKMSTWSPMIEAVEYEWKFWNVNSPSKYIGKPTMETEMEWDYLWQCKIFLYECKEWMWNSQLINMDIDGSLGIPESKLHLLNKSMDRNWLRTPEELGGGVTGLFEGFHQIHCLNLVRQYMYRNEYNYGGLPAFDQSPAMLLNHVEHCIEMLRIDLMCFADETPYLIEINDNGEEVVNPNSVHRCRKFERLIDWVNDHIVEPYNATLELMKHADSHYEKNSSANSILESNS